MRTILVTLLVVLMPAALAAGQGIDNPGRPIPKERDRVKMDEPPVPGSKSEKPAGKEASEAPAKEPADPFERALAGLATWPSPKAKEAAAAVMLLGPEVEPKLVAELSGASPSLTCGIVYVLGEIGGDDALRAVQTVAGRPSMVDHLDVVFEALGKLDGLNAVKRVIPFLRHPKRPARVAAEEWLRLHVDESHVDRLASLLEDDSRGARLSALRLLARVAPERARERAFDRLGDESPEIARTAADLLSTADDPATIARLNDTVQGPDDRAVAYAAIALALHADRTGDLPYAPATVESLLGRSGIRALGKLNRGAAAIVLADVGFAGSTKAVDELLDREVVDVLLDTFGGQSFFKDYNSLAELARERFGRLTGILERQPVPELWAWWEKHREGFSARRTLGTLDPDAPGALRVKARSHGEPALATSLFSTVAADAGRPETLGTDFVCLLPEDASALAALLAEKIVPLPAAGVVDPFRSRGGADFGPDVILTVSKDARSRTVVARRGEVPAAISDVLRELVRLKGKYAWQRYWDRATWPRFEDFVTAEAKWFAAEHPPEAVAVHRKEMILRSLDDLVTADDRIAAMDELEATKAPLSDSDAYALALLLDREDDLTPFAERLVDALARAGRPLVLPLLSNWLEQHPAPRSLELFSRALAKMGPTQVLTAAASNRVFMVRAAMRAAPEALTGSELFSTLEEGLREGADPVRREALLALGSTGAEEALPLIRAALDDPEPAIRNAAIEAIGLLGRPESVTVLTKEVTSDDFGRRVAAVTALARTGLDAALSPVLACLKRDPSAAVRAVAAREIVGFGGRALPGLSAIVVDAEEDAPTRAQAVNALVRVGGDQVVAILTALLGDPAPEVADAAAYALATRQKKVAFPRLLDALENGRDPIRTVAALEQVSCRSFPTAKTDELPTIYRGFWADHQAEDEADWFVSALAERGYEVADLAGLAAGDPPMKAAPVLIRVLLDGAWYLRANANLWLGRVALKDFGEITRFTPTNEVRDVQARWRDWWESR